MVAVMVAVMLMVGSNTVRDGYAMGRDGISWAGF